MRSSRIDAVPAIRHQHLLSGPGLTRTFAVPPDLTRHHGESNGLRVHAVAFGLTSLAVLLLALGAFLLVALQDSM